MIYSKLFLSVLVLLFSFYKVQGAVLPKDSAALNYTTVYFEEDLVDGAVTYELYLYSDSLTGSTDHLMQDLKSSLPAFWVSGLEWSRNYSWRVKAYDKNQKEISAGKPHKFFTTHFSSYRHEKIQLDIKTNKPEKHSGGLVSLDYSRCIFNRQGRIVWTLPNIPNLVNDGTQIRDLQLTKDNTITFLTGKVPVEVDLNGNVLWKGPARFTIENDTISYHHDFKKTGRGTYMVMGSKLVYRRMIGTYAEEPPRRRGEVKVIDSVKYKRTPIDILLEFNADGKLIWFWDANDYVKDVDLNYKKTREGFPSFSVHGNAFSENAAGTKVYIGFRDLNRIIRIDKKTKKVELSYGEKYPSGDAKFGHGLFKNQHDANVTTHNSIFIFNNNGPRGEGAGVSSIIELKDNVTPKDSDNVLLWKFTLDFDTLTDGKSANQGNVVELPNGNVLLCAGAMNRVFEVTKDKEVVWDAFILSKQKNGKGFEPFPQYRCHWMPQITEHHFIPQIISQPVLQNGMINLTVSIANTGNADDAYIVEVYAGSKLIHKLKPLPVKTSDTSNQAITFKAPAKTAQLVVKLSSVHSNVVSKLPLVLK